MTNWLPTLDDSKSPIYVRLANAIEHDIEAGTLRAGSKLPPHRNLAFDIGVTVGTVSRAYAMVRERGLVTGEVGRGTYVRNQKAETKSAYLGLQRYQGLFPKEQPALITMNSTSAPEVGQTKLIADHFTDIAINEPRSVSDYLRHISENWRAAGQAWIARDGWEPDFDNVLPTQGAHAALMAVLSTATVTGDRIVFEELTYPATVRSTIMIGRRAIKVRSTDEGIDPDDFEHVCAQQHPKIAVIVATMNNPTLTTMPLENRLKIVESARRHNVLLLDDDTYGVLKPDAPPPFAALAPERTFHVTSLSKSVAAGLRAGYVACPPGYVNRVMNAHRLLTGSAPRAMQEIASRLVLSGQANIIRDKVRKENDARVAKARRSFDGFDFASDPNCPFIWLRLPEPWVPSTFCKAALAQNVIVEEADEFKVGQMERATPFVRIALTGSLAQDRVDDGLAVLRQLLEQPALAYDTIE